MRWDAGNIRSAEAFDCGHCDARPAGERGWEAAVVDVASAFEFARVLLCPNCNMPTIVVRWKGGVVRQQWPQAPTGRDVEHLPEDVARAYQQARDCIGVGANDAAALMLRNLIAHVAVECDAPVGKRYAEYVTWLRDNHYMPPGGDRWVDTLRKLGNETAHELIEVSDDQARLALAFAEQLIRHVYEATGMLNEVASAEDVADSLANEEEAQ